MLKPKCKYYKKYGVDIWDLCKFIKDYNDKRIWVFYIRYVKRREYYFKQFKRYVFRIDIIEKKVKYKRKNYRFISIRLLRLYYIFVKDRQFRKFAYKAKKMLGVFESNYCFLLECRLICYIYRMNFVFSIFDSINMLKRTGFIIKKRIIRAFRFVVPVTTLVLTPYLNYYRNYFKLRADSKNFHFSKVRYVNISYFFCYMYMWRKPRVKDLAFPFEIDIFRITGFY